MKTTLAVIVCLNFVIPALADEPKPPPDPVLIALKDKLEQEFQKTEPKPTFEFPNHYNGKFMIGRFKNRSWLIHPRAKDGRRAETVEKSEGPSDDGFRLAVEVQPLGTVNQLAVPQTVREPYWSTYFNVYPVKNTQKQLYFCLSYGGWTAEKQIAQIKRAAEQLSITEKRDNPNKQQPQGR